MEGTVVVINRNTPWMTKTMLAEELGCSASYIHTLVKGMKKEIPGRYSPYVAAGERYNFYAIIDYATYRDSLKDNNLRKYVPPFNPSEIAELSGFCQKMVKFEGEQKKQENKLQNATCEVTKDNQVNICLTLGA